MAIPIILICLAAGVIAIAYFTSTTQK